ncbi:NigD-like protein [uncultured Parabacteroides sp.]|uniref:NigD-like protein n=1 Tax=uncultured Parabacteroides sp. TaxID=512312 RepID=UPI0025833D52|nr:NigD-like protein [uncultured Parabacteroides sp.]
MKTLKLFLMATGVLFTSLTFQSCLDDDDYYYGGNWRANALVTVKPVSDDSFFLQLDDTTTLFPVNITSSPYGDKEVRALVNCRLVDKPSEGYSKAVYVNWIDSILTKQMAPDLGVENDSVYGTDPVEMLKDWVTIAEDGYLTLRFRTLWGDRSKAHFVNLLVSEDPANPYEVEFRHNAYGDVHGIEGDGLVAFNLAKLPDTNGKTVKLKLKWKSFSGDKSAEFDYCTRKSTPGKSTISDERSVLNMK